MKIILSRKGFDSSFGGCASPIFEDKSFASLPIPECFSGVPLPTSPVKYSEVKGIPHVYELVEDLSRQLKKPIKASSFVHLDPDLRRESLPRQPGWRPMFGQSHSAQRHLQNHGICEGDIFLFFGWFREVEKHEGRWNFKRGARDLHVFFGWLRVGEVWHLDGELTNIPEWAKSHPHLTPHYGPNNTIYVANGNGVSYSAGTFPLATDGLILTRPESARSSWRLPKWFHPLKNTSKLTYHSNPSRWESDKNYAYLQCVARGQEFIFDTADYPQAEEWARRLISDNAG